MLPVYSGSGWWFNSKNEGTYPWHHVSYGSDVLTIEFDFKIGPFKTQADANDFLSELNVRSGGQFYPTGLGFDFKTTQASQYWPTFKPEKSDLISIGVVAEQTIAPLSQGVDQCVLSSSTQAQPFFSRNAIYRGTAVS